MAATRYLIIGGGIAGTTAADAIRQEDATGDITIVSGEPYRLYSRIMISKAHYFMGKVPAEQIWLKKESWYVEKNVKLIAGRMAAKLDPQAKIVTLDDGAVLPYDKLLLALGVCARRWSVPGADKQGVFYARTLADFQAYKPASAAAKAAVVIGGGAIGFEMCELMRLAGLETTLVIREPHYWDPVLDQASGRLIEAALERGGVKIIRNQYVTEAYGSPSVASAKGGGASVEGVILQDGTKIPCQMVNVGIGGFCPLDWLKTSGLKTNRGVVANEYLETSLPDVWTAGDAAEYHDPIYEETIQFGSWSNAQNQGRRAGLNMTGKRETYQLVTFYAVSGLGINIAFIGDIAPVTPESGKETVCRGSFEQNAYARYILKGGRLLGATLINRTADVGPLTKLIGQKTDVSAKKAELADPNFDLKNLVPAQSSAMIPDATPSVPVAPKIRIGWFSYSCCEDSTIVLTEMMNDHWQEWKQMFEFVHARVLQANNRWEPMDVAFIEGAIADEHQADEVRKIRGLAKKVVAIGSCACTGMPSAQRNKFNDGQKAEIQFLIEKFKASPQVRKLAEVIKVDAEVPGCPMAPKNFLAAVDKMVAELKGAK